MRGIFFAIITFIISTLLIPLFILSSCDINVPSRDKPRRVEENIIESDLKITVLNHETNEVMELFLEEYIANVVAAEMPAAFDIEALKAQAVAARTYAIWKMMAFKDRENPQHPEAVLCTSHTHCQEWLSMEDLRERHGRLWMYNYWDKIQEAVEDTRGIIMTYNMEPIEPLYHSTSGGRTENAEDVFSNAKPYLKSVASPYEERSPVLTDTKSLAINDFINTLKSQRNAIDLRERNLTSQIQIIERSAGGRVKRVKIGNEEFTGSEVRQIFDLRSANFTIEIRENNIIFTTRGYGHGVGMSQWGANGMAEQGHNYEEILKHYYQGITLSKLKSYQ